MTEVERPVLTALFNRAILPEDKRDAAAADDAEKSLTQPLQVLDGALGRSANLLGAGFTVADLNVASILAWARPAQIDMAPFPKVAEWLKELRRAPGGPRRPPSDRERADAAGQGDPSPRDQSTGEPFLYARPPSLWLNGNPISAREFSHATCRTLPPPRDRHRSASSKPAS